MLGDSVLFLFLCSFKSKGYGTEQEKAASQLQVPRHYIQALRRAIPVVAQLLQSPKDDSY